jgi:hypothetical protein
MILRIFIAIISFNTLSVSGALALHPEENDPLLARRTTQNTEQHTSWSVSVWSVMNSAYNKITHIMPTPEEILREKLRNIVFPDGRNADGRNAAGELRKHTLPKEAIANQYDMRVLCTDLEGKIAYTDNTETYYLAIITLDGCASMGCKDAFSLLAWLFESHHDSHKIKWQYPDRERACWFREVANKTQEEIYEVLQNPRQNSSKLPQCQQESKKER